MTAPSPLPLSLIELARALPPPLKSLDSIPLTGYETLFPWQAFSEKIATLFQLDHVHITPTAIAWRSGEELLEGLGSAPLSFTLAIPPLKGEAIWIVRAQEIGVLASLCLTKDSTSSIDSTLAERFYDFCLLEVLQLCSEFLLNASFKPSFAKTTLLPKESALCIDMALSLQGTSSLGRLCLSPELRASWMELTADIQNEAALLSRGQAQTLVPLHLEIGKVTLALSDWQKLKEGDCLILDSCSLKGEELEGKIAITHQGKVVHRAKLKNQKLKILEPPLLREVDTLMTSDADEPFQEESETWGDEERESEEVSFFETNDGEALSTNEMQDGEKRTEAAPTEAQEAHSPETKSFISPAHIPLCLSVEIGKVEMTIERLLQLEPGNFLEVNVNPKQGVDLTIQGKLVGKGELVRFEESIGVRITDLGRYE